MLALDAHPVRGDPHKRVEPEDCDRQLGNDLRERVDALDVRHLVHEHVSTPLLGPAVGVVRQQYYGVDDAPRYRHLETSAAKERHRPCDAETKIGRASCRESVWCSA